MKIPGNFEVREPKVESTLNDLGKLLRDKMPEGWGFSLLIVKKGEGPGIFYTSDMDRQDMVATMQDFVNLAREH
jgi:hypothetical protein